MQSELGSVVSGDRGDRVCGQLPVDGQLRIQGGLRGGAGQFHRAQVPGDAFHTGVERTGTVRSEDTVGFSMPELEAVFDLGRAGMD